MDPQTPDTQRLIEFGWLIVEPIEPPHLEAIQLARDRVLTELTRQFPDFQWRIPWVEHQEPTRITRREPADLLQQGTHERETRRWDFALVITDSDLQSYYKPYALAVPSRAIAVAVLSTIRLVPRDLSSLSDQERRDRMVNRIVALALHMFGDLNGLNHRNDPDAVMNTPQAVDDLDNMLELNEQEQRQLTGELGRVADTRLEEQPHNAGPVQFYMTAVWIGRKDILSAIRQAKPWEFPLRLSRLTTAALSTLLILLMTAEVWDLGMSQSTRLIINLTLLALAGTSIFILKRQRLLLRRSRRGLTEQTVVTNVSITVIVLLGMVTTYLALFILVLGLGYLFYSPALIAGWAASLDGAVDIEHHLILAGFVASLGIIIGALGASFEGQQYFRHITYADEET